MYAIVFTEPYTKTVRLSPVVYRTLEDIKEAIEGDYWRNFETWIVKLGVPEK